MTDRPTSASKSAAASGPATQKRNPVARILAAQWLPLILLVLAVVFIAQNRARISINLFWAHLESPLWFILVITIVVGLIIGLLTARRRAQRGRQR
jgi:lipopolysaccharide assembly protein A